MRNLITILSFGALFVAGLLSVAWFYSEKTFEPFITSLLIFAAITGFFVEKWISDRGKRKRLLFALTHELFINMGVLEDATFRANNKDSSKFVVFPRLESSIVNDVIRSGSFLGARDKLLFKMLHIWRERIQQFNNRLDLTEIACLLNPSPDNILMWREKLSSGGMIQQVKDAYIDITNELLNNYSNESGVDRDTELFK